MEKPRIDLMKKECIVEVEETNYGIENQDLITELEKQGGYLLL